MKRLTLTLMLLALACAGARGQEGAGQAAAEKRRDIGRLLQLNGSAAASVQVFEQLLPNMREIFGTMFESMPARTRETAIRIMEEESRRGFTAERMTQELIPIYERYLTAEDVKALIAFYESPAGRKLVAVQPLLIREGSTLGEKIGSEVVERILKRYQEEGIAPPPARRPQTSAPPRRPRPR